MKYLFLIISALIVVSINAQQSETTYLKIHKTYELNEDGSYDYTYTHQLKYHSFTTSQSKFGETTVLYNPDYQEVEVKESNTTMRDGEVVTAEDESFFKILPRFAESTEKYNNLRKLIITHAGIEKGAVVDLTYTVHSDTMPAGFLSGKESLIYSSPVNELELTFKVPATTDLSFDGNIGEKDFNKNEGQKVYTFVYKDLPANINQQKTLDEDAFALYFNQGKKFETQLLALMHSKLKPEEYDKTYGPAVEKNMDEVLRIHRKMVKEMRTINVPLAFQELPVPPIRAIQLNHEGTPIEKALLMRQKLWEINVDANIAFELPVNQFNEKVSNLENITNIYVMVPTNYDPLLLPIDRIPSANPLFTNYDKVIVALNNDGEISKLVPQTNNYGEMTMSLSVGEDYSEFQYQGVANGMLAGWPGANFQTPKRMTNYVVEIEDDISIQNPASIKMRGRFKSENTQLENFLRVNLPLLNAGFNQFIADNLPNDRDYVVEYGYPLVETYTYNIENNNDCKLIKTPKDIEIVNEHFEIKVSINESEKETTVTQSVKIKSAAIPTEYYDKLRKGINHLGEKENRTVLFKCD